MTRATSNDNTPTEEVVVDIGGDDRCGRREVGLEEIAFLSFIRKVSRAICCGLGAKQRND
jgi:hypothetical protein